jgi:hypothetical protein
LAMCNVLHITHGIKASGRGKFSEAAATSRRVCFVQTSSHFNRDTWFPVSKLALIDY